MPIRTFGAWPLNIQHTEILVHKVILFYLLKTIYFCYFIYYFVYHFILCFPSLYVKEGSLALITQCNSFVVSKRVFLNHTKEVVRITEHIGQNVDLM